MKAYWPHLEWIDAQADRMRAMVIDWANVNTGSYNVAGLAAFSRMMLDSWAPLNPEVSEIKLADHETIDSAGKIARSPLGNALVLRKRSEARLQVFLCIHMDTVYTVDSPLQICRQIDANTLGGPGVTDAKGGLAIMQIVVEALERSPWSEAIGWEVLINPDEELGSPGSSPLFEIAARRNHLGLLFEPAFGDGDLVSERGGSGTYDLVVHGRGAHAGRDPAAGRNAIRAMAEMIGDLYRLASDGVAINVGKVEGGGAVNVVPDLAICRFNVRVKTLDDERRFKGNLQDFFAENEGRRDGIRMELHGGFHRPPKALDAATRRLLDHTIHCGRDLNLRIGHCRTGGVSDGNQLAAAGLPNLDSLGPRGGRIHSPDEFLLLDSLAERAKLAALLLMKLASGEIAWDGTGKTSPCVHTGGEK